MTLVLISTMLLPGVASVKSEGQNNTILIENGKITETAYIVEDGIVTKLSRISTPDNRAELITETAGTISQEYQNIDYNVLFGMLSEGVDTKSVRVDIEGPNFYHRFLASKSYTVTRAQGLESVAAVAGVIGGGLSLPLEICVNMAISITGYEISGSGWRMKYLFGLPEYRLLAEQIILF